MNITIPSFSLVVLISVSGSGKSTFDREHFSLGEAKAAKFGPRIQMAVFEAEGK